MICEPWTPTLCIVGIKISVCSLEEPKIPVGRVSHWETSSVLFICMHNHAHLQTFACKGIHAHSDIKPIQQPAFHTLPDLFAPLVLFIEARPLKSWPVWPLLPWCRLSTSWVHAVPSFLYFPTPCLHPIALSLLGVSPLLLPLSTPWHIAFFSLRGEHAMHSKSPLQPLSSPF